MTGEVMNAKDVKQIVEFVKTHSGCSQGDIQKALPEIQGLSELLEKMSEGAKMDEGFILCRDEGRFYLDSLSGLDM